ncbi:glycosyltransferase family 4 protein [Patescibacteria group bacterium]|nr:glycosyltransferase family 4 protein [Patescibacteria group bacterium]
MRVSLDTGAITPLDQNRGIGVYANEMCRHLPKYVQVTDNDPEIIHNLVFKLFHPAKLPAPGLVVITVHDLIPLKYPQAYPPGIRGRLTWWRQKNQLRQAAGIITDSQASKQDIIKFTGINEDKIFVVYLAVDEVFKPVKAVNKYSLPNKFALYVGDLNWNKNVVSLTKACISLKIPLVVVGRQAVVTDYDHSHPETSELVKFQRLAKKYPKRIIRLGTVPLRDLAAIYNLATVYVQPSRYEGFGLPVLEALSCGCPVLSSGAGSLPEITGKACLHFSQKNLKLVWQNADLRSKLTQAGLAQAKKFSWQKTVRQTVAVYEKIIADSFNH